MSYTPNMWQARQGTGLNRFVDQNKNYWYLTPAPESVVTPGTPFSADWMNHIEQGIADIDNSLAEPNGIATLDSSGKLVQMPTAADVGAVTQTVYELTLSDEWEPNSESSACFLIVTGKIATVIARIRPKEAKTFSSYTLCTLPEGIQIDKYIDAPLVCGGAQDRNMAVQVTPPNKIALFDGEYRKTPYSLNVSFKIV